MSRVEIDTTFGFIILILCGAIIIYIQRNSDGIFSSVFKSGFDRNLANQDARIENSQRTRNMMLLQLVAVISVCLFGSLAFRRLYDTNLTDVTAFFWALAIFLNALMLKRIVQWLLVQVFDLDAELKVYRYSGNIFLTIAGLLLLPISTLGLFSQQIPIELVAIVGIGTLSFFYLKTLLRGLQVSITSPAISPLHLFYYFCALELLPLFVLVHIAQNS